jgi:UDP-N-acetylglucosamine:LPS N-acetylglucosamine transferase
LEKKIFSQINDLTGNIVITLGKTEEEKKIMQNNLQIYSFLTKKNREMLMNKAKMVISRSGYSTIMDLAMLGTKALMIPTPGQIEQEYLATYLNHQKIFYSIKQKELQLKKNTETAKKTKGVPLKYHIEKTIENIMDVITNQKTSPFRKQD